MTRDSLESGSIERSNSLNTDSDLLEGARKMEPEAWRRLVDRYSQLILRWCRYSHLSEDNAADVLQVVLAQVARYLPGFQRDGRAASFRRWLRTITRSKISEFHRKNMFQPQAMGGSGGQFELQTRTAIQTWSSTSIHEPDPNVERLWRLIEELEDEFEESTWRAFWLTMVDECTSPEAGAQLGMSANAVRLAKSRVLQRLRAAAADK